MSNAGNGTVEEPGAAQGRFWWVTAIAVAVIAAYGFVAIWAAVHRGGTVEFDKSLLRTLRRANDPAVPIGPRWLRESALDVTCLGSHSILLIVVLSAAGFMALQRRTGLALWMLATTGGGALFVAGLKIVIGRERPSVVPHLREISTPSFPSGHASLSAVVYLTMGILLADAFPKRRLKFYCLTWAALLALAAGGSRVYLGVHYPTDVLAGWAIGLAWAVGSWALAHYFASRRITSIHGE